MGKVSRNYASRGLLLSTLCMGNKHCGRSHGLHVGRYGRRKCRNNKLCNSTRPSCRSVIKIHSADGEGNVSTDVVLSSCGRRGKRASAKTVTVHRTTLPLKKKRKKCFYVKNRHSTLTFKTDQKSQVSPWYLRLLDKHSRR